MKKLFFSFALACSLFANPIKVGISPDYPPFDALVNGKITGFDAELFSAIAKKAGVEFNFVAMNFDGLVAGLKTGKIDAVISAMSASEGRKKACDFSDVYYKAKSVYIKHKNSAFSSKNELAGKKIGVQLGTVQELAARAISGKVQPNENPTTLVMALNKGKLDALILDALVGREFLAKNPNLVEFYSEDDGTQGFSIAFNKGKNKELQAKLNQALKEFLNSAEYAQLLDKYGIQ